MGAKDNYLSDIVSISRGETHQPIHKKSKNKAGKWRDYKTQSKRVADNTTRGKGRTMQDIGSATTSRLRQSNTQQSNRKAGGQRTTQ